MKIGWDLGALPRDEKTKFGRNLRRDGFTVRNDGSDDPKMLTRMGKAVKKPTLVAITPPSKSEVL